MEYVNITEFAKRCSVQREKVTTAIKTKAIEVFDRGTGGGPKAGYRICWDTQHKKFLTACKDAALSPKKTWVPGVQDPERRTYYGLDDEPLSTSKKQRTKPSYSSDVEESDSDFDEETDEDSAEIDEELASATDAKLLTLLDSNTTTMEAERIRKVIRARQDLLNYQKSKKELVPVAQLRPAFEEAAILLQKRVMSITPRVSTQFAALTDHFKISAMLNKELEQALSAASIFGESLGKK